jgi:hypothetical protein
MTVDEIKIVGLQCHLFRLQMSFDDSKQGARKMASDLA